MALLMLILAFLLTYLSAYAIASILSQWPLKVNRARVIIFHLL